MKLTTRIALCLTLLAVCLVGITLHQLGVVERIHSINRELGATQLQATRVSVRLLQGIEGLREFAAKALLLGDADYFESWAAWEEAVSEELRTLVGLDLAGAEATHRAELLEAWRRYQAEWVPIRLGRAPSSSQDQITPAQSRLAGPPPAQAATSPPPAAGATGVTNPTPPIGITVVDQIDGVLEPLRVATERLIAANDAAVAQRVEESVAAVDRARDVAWFAAVGSMILVLFLSVGLFAYISGPLRRLTHGTREIARGNFAHRIPVNRRGGDELSDLARDFNDMAQRLGELAQTKEDFIAHVSHELKAPLASIHETILVLLERIPGPLTPKQEHLLDLSFESARRLSAMIHNLLQASRLDAGPMQYEFANHDVIAITRAVLSELAPLATQKRLDVRLTGEGDTELWCDAERLRDVVANLVGNAIKFSPQDSPVHVSWRHLDTPPESMPRPWKPPADATSCMLLTVEDRGPGVPDAHKEGIFERFFQANLQTRVRGQGVGLGLAISRTIVEGHGGTIWVEDAPGGGSRFQALFPCTSRRPATESPANSATWRQAQRTTPVAVRSAGVAALAVTVAFATGCSALRGAFRGAPSPQVDEVQASAEETDATVPTWSARTFLLSLLDQADSLLAANSPGPAAELYRETLNWIEIAAPDSAADLVNRATWGLAVTYLVEPTRDYERARILLRELENRGGSPESVTARTVGRLLDDVGRLRSQVAEQQAAIQALNEMVEQLKLIDLNRRPAPNAGNQTSGPP